MSQEKKRPAVMYHGFKFDNIENNPGAVTLLTADGNIIVCDFVSTHADRDYTIPHLQYVGYGELISE